MELLLGLLTYLVIGATVRLGQRWFSDVARDRRFESWCQGEPIVVALRCRSDAHVARMHLRQLVAPHDEVENHMGGVPWQHYRFAVDIRGVGDRVLLVVITGCQLARDGATRVDVAEVVRTLVADPRAEIDEVWLHGQLHELRPSAHGVDRNRRHWLGEVEDGALRLREMIGAPEWARG